MPKQQIIHKQAPLGSVYQVKRVRKPSIDIKAQDAAANKLNEEHAKKHGTNPAPEITGQLPSKEATVAQRGGFMGANIPVDPNKPDPQAQIDPTTINTPSGKLPLAVTQESLGKVVPDEKTATGQIDDGRGCLIEGEDEPLVAGAQAPGILPASAPATTATTSETTVVEEKKTVVIEEKPKAELTGEQAAVKGEVKDEGVTLNDHAETIKKPAPKKVRNAQAS